LVLLSGFEDGFNSSFDQVCQVKRFIQPFVWKSADVLNVFRFARAQKKLAQIARRASFLAVARLGPRQSRLLILWGRVRSTSILRIPQTWRDWIIPSRTCLRTPISRSFLDEIHRAPDPFAVLRGQINAHHRVGRASGYFLILGSAVPELLRKSSDSLAGRPAYLERDLAQFGFRMPSQTYAR